MDGCDDLVLFQGSLAVAYCDLTDDPSFVLFSLPFGILYNYQSTLGNALPLIPRTSFVVVRA